MGDVININADAVTIQDVMNAVAESKPSQVYCVTIDAKGDLRLWASGNTNSLPTVALALTNLAMDHVREKMK